MNNDPNRSDRDLDRRQKDMISKLSRREARRIRARRQGDRSVFFGIGMFGLIGWAIAIPTLIGIALGVWIDTRYPSRFSWTLMLLFVGLVIGCMNAWLWVKNELKKEEEEQRE